MRDVAGNRVSHRPRYAEIASRRNNQPGARRASSLKQAQRFARFHPQTIHIPQDPVTLAYIACLLDGEGTIVTQYTRVNPCGRMLIGISNTYEPVIRWVQETIGGYVQQRVMHLNLKPIWCWRLTATRDQLAFLIAVIPYLKIKLLKAWAAHAWLECQLEGIDYHTDPSLTYGHRDPDAWGMGI